MSTTKQPHELVRVEHFNVDILKEAFLQGRLYIQRAVTSEVESKEESMQAILRYVSRTDMCTSDAYQSSIQHLWQRILCSPELGHSFFLYRYSTSRGKPNWYRVNAVVVTLLELNVYRRHAYKGAKLHKLMEGSECCNRYYTGMSRYLLDRQEIAVLKRLVGK